jgi:hypothetical protein
MKRVGSILSCICITAAGVLIPPSAEAQRRPVVIRRPPLVKRPLARVRVALRPGHPLRRTLPATVVVRPARRVVTVGYPLVFLPSVQWLSRPTVLPGSERLVWQDSETIEKEEGWVDANFGVDSNGNGLLLQIDGRTKLNFAEVVFMNGTVQVVDFNEKTSAAGLYDLLDFADGRHVSTVRILVRSESNESKLTVYLSK